MEVCIPGPEKSRTSGSSTIPGNSTNSNLEDLPVDGLKTHLTEFMSIEDIKISTAGFNLIPGKSSKGNTVGEDDCEDVDYIKSNNSASEKFLSHHVAFPALDNPKSPVDGLSNEEKVREDDRASDVECCAKPIDQGHSQCIPKPTPPKLVSAMRGTREKQGISHKKLSVTWAPDVYDPIPTSVSHVPSNKNQHYRNDGKRYGKKKQRGGKSQRGSKGKDKKQARKNNGNPCKSKPHHNNVVVDFDKPQIGDFNIVSPDPFCGSSFLKKTITNIHFPVAEAK